MISKISGIEMIGVATALPENKVRNLDYAEQFGETEVKKQIKVTGINERYVMKDPQKPSDLAIAAAKKLFKAQEIKSDEIRVLVYVTAYTDFLIPTTSAYIKYMLGIDDNCICFDVNLGCSSFLNGSYIIATYLKQMKHGEKGLLLIADTVNYGGEKLEKSTSMLSSDCGAACVFENMGTEKDCRFKRIYAITGNHRRYV